jgi:hypothetical protein
MVEYCMLMKKSTYNHDAHSICVVPHALLRTLNRGARGQLMNMKDILTTIIIMLHISDDDVAQKDTICSGKGAYDADRENHQRDARAVWTHSTMY